jgi:hypothetical protein
MFIIKTLSSSTERRIAVMSLCWGQSLSLSLSLDLIAWVPLLSISKTVDGQASATRVLKPSLLLALV